MFSMEHFDEIFQHSLQHRVIICKSCCYAVFPSHIIGHLEKHHNEVPEQIRQRIVRHVEQMHGVASTREEVEYPRSPIPPIPHLPVFRNGFQCQWQDRSGRRCLYVCRGRTTAGIQRHCKAAHKWRNWQERGGRVGDRSKQTPNRIWIDGQDCQRFFKRGEWERYFVVQREVEAVPPTTATDPVSQADAIFAQYQGDITEAKAQRAVEGDSNRFVTNAWLSFTGWAGHLSQFQTKEQIQAYIQPVENQDDDDGLEHVVARGD